MSLEQYKDASRKEMWDILQIQMQVLQAETAKVAELEKEKAIGVYHFTVEEYKAHNLEQRAKGIDWVLACRELNLSEGEVHTLMDKCNRLCNQAKALKEQVK